MVDCKKGITATFHPSLHSHLLGNVTLQHLLLRARISLSASGSRVASGLSLAERMQGKTLCAKSESKPQEDFHYLYLFSWNPAATMRTNLATPLSEERHVPQTPL